jgi:hypothetical protein
VLWHENALTGSRYQNNSRKSDQVGSRYSCGSFVYLQNVSLSEVKAVANLEKDFAGIQIVCSAKSEAVIQKNAPVCDVETLNIQGKTLAKTLSNREVERSVRL